MGNLVRNHKAFLARWAKRYVELYIKEGRTVAKLYGQKFIPVSGEPREEVKSLIKVEFKKHGLKVKE